MGTDLASIGDFAEHQFISSKIIDITLQFWIGLVTETGSIACRVNTLSLNCSDADREHNCCLARRGWTWTDGTLINVSQWMINEPSDSNTSGKIGHSISSSTNLEGCYWYEGAAVTEFRYICERALPTSPSTTSFISPTNSRSTSAKGNSSSSNTAAIAAGVVVAVCSLLAFAVLAAVCLIRRYRREKQPPAKTQAVTMPVDTLYTRTVLEQSSTNGTEYARFISRITNNTHTADKSYENMGQEEEEGCRNEPAQLSVDSEKNEYCELHCSDNKAGDDTTEYEIP